MKNNSETCQVGSCNPVYDNYGGTEFSVEEVGWFYYKDEFRVLQPLWKFCLSTMGRQGIESPLSLGTIPIFAYFFGVTFFTICDVYGENWHWIQKYKLQRNRVSPKVIFKAIRLTMWNQVVLILPILMMQYVAEQPKIVTYALAPPLWEFVWQIAAMITLFDFQYYFWHYIHHKSRRLYKWCHIIHHEFHTPQAWSAQYLHPWELLCIGVYNGVLPSLFGCHWLTCTGMSLFNVYVSVIGHCGYDLPVDLNNMFPWLSYIWGGARKHDMHHMKPFTNFQPFFSTFDRLLGDECPGLLAGHTKPDDLMEYEKNREKKALEWYQDMPERSVEDD